MAASRPTCSSAWASGPSYILEGCRRAVEMGVYPFVVPLRPVPGTLMADTPTPDPEYVGQIYREVSAMIADAGLDHLDAKAGCARCQACSGLSAWERVAKRERSRDGDDAPRRFSRLARASAALPPARPSWPRTTTCAAACSWTRRGCSRAATATTATRREDTVHVVGLVDGAVVGAVRLYPLDRHGLWKGDRLAVLPEARVRHLGAELVRFAVATAGELGGQRMVAQVQVPNVRFFEHLGWSRGRAAGALSRRHAPADGDPAVPGASPVSGVRERSHTGAASPRRPD